MMPNRFDFRVYPISERVIKLDIRLNNPAYFGIVYKLFKPIYKYGINKMAKRFELIF